MPLSNPATGSGAPTVVQGGNLGATETVAMAGESYVHYHGTLDANCAVTVTGLTEGDRIDFFFTQDATGSRTVTIDDGGGAVACSVGATALSTTKVEATYNGTDLLFEAPGSALGAQTLDAFELTDLARTQGWAPTGALAETFRRVGAVTSNLAALSPGRLHLVGGVVLPKDRAATSITFVSGSTAMVTPTNQWFCLVQASDLAVLRKTVDDTSTAWAVNSPKTLNLSSTYTPTAADLAVYLGVVVAAGTVPSLRGVSGGTGGIAEIAPIANASSTTGLTDPASLGATAGALTANANVPYAYVS